MKNKLIISFMTTVIFQLIGIPDSLVVSLLIIMAVDWITGCISGINGKSPKTPDGKLNSYVGFKGLIKKGVILLVIVAAYQLEKVSGISNVRDLVIVAFICNEVLSIIENADHLGIPVPKVIKNIVSSLEEKS